MGWKIYPNAYGGLSGDDSVPCCRKVPGGGEGGDPNFLSNISSSWVEIRLLTENHLPGLP